MAASWLGGSVGAPAPLGLRPCLLPLSPLFTQRCLRRGAAAGRRGAAWAPRRAAGAVCGPEERDRPPCCEWHAPEGLQCDWHTAASGSAAETPAATPTAMRPLARSTSTNEAMRNALARSAERCRARGGVPVTVMLPLDCVDQTGLLKYASQRWFEHALASLKAVGCSGVMVDVWWGAVEREPRTYDWAPYRQLLEQVRRAGLRLQVVMAFHACGGNVNDTVNLPLPRWVLDAGDEDADIWYTDRAGNRNRECVSLFADEEARLDGRSPLQCYEDFMRSFGDAFQRDLQQGGAISEVLVGCGPCGELRYPSYPEALGWRFPGIGEFQCYDKRALASLAEAAEEYGEPEWGSAGPHDAGGYNARPHEAGFFAHGGWDSEYGRFFTGWYGHQLLAHADRLMHVADRALRSRYPHLAFGMKCAGVHWWHGMESRPAEVTAGYCPIPLQRAEDLLGRGEADDDGSEDADAGDADAPASMEQRRVPFYTALARLFQQHRIKLAFTCVEMAATDHPPEFACAPEALLREVRVAAALEGVGLLGENALEVYGRGAFNRPALDRMLGASRQITVPLHELVRARTSRNTMIGAPEDEASGSFIPVLNADGDAVLPPLAGLTFLRLSVEMMKSDYADPWQTFVRDMSNPARAGQAVANNSQVSSLTEESKPAEAEASHA